MIKRLHDLKEETHKEFVLSRLPVDSRPFKNIGHDDIKTNGISASTSNKAVLFIYLHNLLYIHERFNSSFFF